MKPVWVDADGEQGWVWVQNVGGQLWYHYRGQTHVSDATPRTGVRHRRSGIAALDTKCIRAPMPGKIVKVFKKLGDQVTEGDTIIVLEAMKMEYSLAAAQSGKIKKLEGKEGKQVSLGDLLVELSEEKTN